MQKQLMVKSVREVLASGESALGVQVLHRRSRARGMLLRVPLPGGTSVIAKVWRARKFKDHFRRVFRWSNALHEWRIHRTVERIGLSVPKPLHYFRCIVEDRFEVMIVADLGDVVTGIQYLKRRGQEGADQAIARFEQAAIDMTDLLVRSGIADGDHHFNNMVVDDSEFPIRIDFECARRYRFRRLPDDRYSEMLARLISSHVFAFQPEVRRTEAFAARLFERLKPSRAVMAMVEERLQKRMDRQAQRQGVETSLSVVT